MKKGLIIIAAALFVAAMVLPAMAVDMSLSGFYRVRGFYQSNADSGMVTPWDAGAEHGAYNADDPEAWWDHMLQLNPVFKVADNLKLVTRVSMFNNQMWGSTNTSGAVADNDLTPSSFNTAADNIIFNRAYIEWATPKGTLKVGRMAGNYTFFLPFGNTELDADRIVYVSPNYSGFNVVLGHEKRVEGSVGTDEADKDHDRYFAILQYACPGLYVGYAPDWYRDRQSDATARIDKINHNFCLKLNDPTNTFFFEGELQYRDGEYDSDSGTDYDYDGLGYYAAAGMRKGPLTACLATAFCSGDDNSAATTDDERGTPFGLDFMPLYIATGPYSNILTSQTGGYGAAMTLDTGMQNTGAQVYLISADYVVNPELAVHGALGVAYAEKTTSGVDDEFGKELDLGLKYQIMSNLAYELHMGYLWTGDYFKVGSASVRTDDVYQIDHSLTLSF
ncbi:MAG: hypothetical protein RDU59_02800 [Thermodesulfobacteriota bacterium]|nr:hypothetical protein [Thermodesulfobacteriota bacterium]